MKWIEQKNCGVLCPFYQKKSFQYVIFIYQNVLYVWNIGFMQPKDKKRARGQKFRISDRQGAVCFYLCSARSKQGHYLQKYCGVIKSCFSTHCQNKPVNLSIFKDSTSEINQFMSKMVFLHQVTLKVSKFQKQIFSFEPKTKQIIF